MADLVNEFSWSRTRDNAFQECRRRYYYQYYGAWGGWEAGADPLVRRLYVLKHLGTRQMWAGRLVHEAVERSLLALRDGHALSEASLIEDTVRQMREEWKGSRDGVYHESPKRTGLFEHEYGVPIKDNEWQAIRDHVIRCLRNFHRLPLLADIKRTSTDRWILIENIGSFGFEGTRVFAAPGLPVQELQPVGVVPVAEVGRAEHARALEGEGADVLDEHPALGRRALDVGQHGQPVEVPQAADHVIAQGLPLAIADGHAVLVLEQGGPLRGLPVDPRTRALPLLAHLAHRILDEGGLAQAVAVAQGQEGALDRLVDEPARPHLAGRELLEDVEAADERVGVGVPAAPGAVVLIVVAPAAVLEDIVAGARPGEFVHEVGHV